jgi:hypothetical protein
MPCLTEYDSNKPMSFYTPEASLITYRIAVIAPSARELNELFEDWAMELETELEPQIKTQMRYVADFKSKGPGARAWLSANLGARGTLGVRLTLLGYNAANSLPKDEVLRRLDGLWVWANPASEASQEILRLGTKAAPIEVPTLLMMPEHRDTFLEKALHLWSKRQVQPSKTHFGKENSLRKGLEWALSFS